VTRHRRRDRGSSTIEFVIGFAVMVLLLMMVIQMVLYFHLRTVAGTAARHGVDRGRLVDGTDVDARAATNEFLDQAGDSLSARQVEASRTVDQVRVTVRGQVPSVMPGVVLDVDVTKSAPPEKFSQ
jgi:hypothetical protein